MWKRLLFALLLSITSTAARGQEEGPAITLADLEGKTISWALEFATRHRAPAIDNSIRSGKVIRRTRLQVGENGTIKVRSARIGYADGVQSHILNSQGTFVVGQPGKSSDGQPTLWRLEKNVLSSVVVLDVGATSNVITLKRTAAGLSCAVEGMLMQEVGAGATKTFGLTKQERFEVLSQKLSSSSCTVQVTDNDGFIPKTGRPNAVFYSMRVWPARSLSIGQEVSQKTPYGQLTCKSVGVGSRECSWR